MTRYQLFTFYLAMPSKKLSILVAQTNPTVGKIRTNQQQILAKIQQHQDAYDVLLFPELALSGYPPEDLLFCPDFHTQIQDALKEIQQASLKAYVIVGHPHKIQNKIYNAASTFFQGQRIAHYHKQHLPNTGVFDEQRYFSSGEARACMVTIQHYRVGIVICEDLWQPGPVEQVLQADGQVLLALNASPYHTQKVEQRISVLQSIAKKGLHVVYANLVGGQDELVFDGQSMVFDPQGQCQARAAAFQEEDMGVTLQGNHSFGPQAAALTKNEELYQALVLGTRDYVHKTGFEHIYLGLSGGIDSALTLVIAKDALGAERVTAVKMPSRHTQAMSIDDADLQIQALGVHQLTLSIEPAYEALLKTLHPVFSLHPMNTAEENLQARIRGTLLMGLANKTNGLILTTSNKSEVAVGYSTLYGDMAGAFNVLKDVYKTQVYALARECNQNGPIIPARVIERAPSAELAPNQTDQDTLPPYPVLDAMLQAIIDEDVSYEELLRRGFSPESVQDVLQRIQRNEYKRQQAPLGVKVTPRAFGRDWRYPITNQFVRF
jgi:NAD+ synthase (glutamine-hydrolysing)